MSFKKQLSFFNVSLIEVCRHHEWLATDSGFPFGIADYGYGVCTIRDLAKNKPAQAILNADTYAWFAQVRLHGPRVRFSSPWS